VCSAMRGTTGVAHASSIAGPKEKTTGISNSSGSFKAAIYLKESLQRGRRRMGSNFINLLEKYGGSKGSTSEILLVKTALQIHSELREKGGKIEGPGRIRKSLLIWGQKGEN